MEMTGNVVQLRPEPIEGDPLQMPAVQEGGYPLFKLKAMFEEAEEAHQKARELAFRDEDYYHNFDDDQWSQAEKQTLADRGQPTYSDNRIKRKVNFLMGMEQRGRTDPKALPRKPQMEMMAEVATDVMHALEDQTKFDQVATEGFFGLLVHGLIASEQAWEPETGEVECHDIPFEEFFFDPRSKKHDFSDARYMGYAKWFDEDDAQMLYSSEEQKQTISNSVDQGRQSFSGYDDRPNYLYATRINNVNRVRVITMYYKLATGEWKLCHFVSEGKLYDVPSPWLCERGKPRCGIIAESLYVDRENRRYGVVRDMIGQQQEQNHLTAKLWHLANDRSFYFKDGVFGDEDEGVSVAKKELAKVDGAVKMNHGFEFGQDFGLMPKTDQVQMISALLGRSDAAIDRMGPNSGLQGRGAATQSGRSRMVQQESGMTEENNVFDRHANWKKRSYESLYLLARQFWRDEMFIRVTDEEDGPRFVQLNQMTSAGIRNNVAQLDVDIIIDTMPDVANLQSEQFETIANILGMGVPPQYLAALIKVSTLRDKEQLIETIMAPMQPDPMAAQKAAMEMTKQEAEIKKTLAETDKIKAEGVHEQASAAVDMTKASLGMVS